MRIDDFQDPSVFLGVATSFLVVEEAVHCILLGVPADMARFGGNPDARFWVVTVDRGQVVGAAMWTPPLSLSVSRMSRDGVGALVEHLQKLHLPLPGVRGPAEEAGWFADAWAVRSAARAEPLGAGEHVWQLNRTSFIRTNPVAASPDHFGLPTQQDFATVNSWASEAAASFDQTADHWAEDIALASRERQLYVWREPEPVAMAMLRGETPSGVRVSGVFTPLAHRRQGYAAALVGAMSEGALNSGRECCFLFTDASNATAEGIYARIGYEQVAACQQYRFVAQSDAE